MSEALVVGAAVLGPAVAAAGWLSVARWPLARRIVGGVLAVASIAAAWALVWSAYRGGDPAWRALAPDLLRATLVAVGEVGILLLAVREDRFTPPPAPGAIAALGVGTSAVVAAAYAQNLVLVALFLVVPTVAALIAALDDARPGLSGIASLAAADAVAIVGLSVLYSRSETVGFASAPGLGVWLVLGAAAAKAGALPWLATARLRTDVASVVRLQGLVLAALAGLELSAAQPTLAIAVAAAAAMLLSGARAALARRVGPAVAGLVGAAAGIPFLALGLGGAVGVRAFLLVAPAFVLAAAVAESFGQDAPEPHRGAAVWRWAGVLSLGVAVASLAGLPPGGGFPGTWLALALGLTRGDPFVLLAVAGAAVGLGMALVAAVPVARAAVPRPAVSILGAVSAVALLYLGAQPLRLAVGWWLRVEAELGLPLLLPSAGAPEVPALGGTALVLVVAPAVAVIAAVVLLGRGVRDAPHPFPASIGTKARRRPRRGERPTLPARMAGASALLVERSRSLGLGLAAVVVIVAAALVLAGRLVMVAARGGFL